jgi:hypothetical protein
MYYFQIKLAYSKESALHKFLEKHPNEGFHFDLGTNNICFVDPGFEKTTNTTIPITLVYPSFEKAKAVAEPLMELK